MDQVGIAITLLFGIFVLQLVWFFTDYHPIQQRLTVYAKRNFIHRYLFEVLIIVPQLFIALFYPLPETKIDKLIIFIGFLLFLSGILLASWAKIYMKQNWGLPATFDKTRQQELVTTGPFALSRNPIYVGLLIALFGFSLALRSYLFFLNFIVLYQMLNVIKKEESHLQRQFGEKFLVYMRKVPRFL